MRFAIVHLHWDHSLPFSHSFVSLCLPFSLSLSTFLYRPSCLANFLVPLPHFSPRSSFSLCILFSPLRFAPPPRAFIFPFGRRHAPNIETKKKPTCPLSRCKLTSRGEDTMGQDDPSRENRQWGFPFDRDLRARYAESMRNTRKRRAEG